MPSQNRYSIRQTIILGLFIAIALVLSYFERFIPITFAVPGVKLGLANVVTVLAITFYKPRDIYLLVVIRVVLASLFIGGMMTLWYSLAGGLLSATTMLLISRVSKGSVSMVGISVVGAISHNIGQIVIVSIITSSLYVGMSYLPVLLVSGVITGVFIGYVGKATKPYLSRMM